MCNKCAFISTEYVDSITIAIQVHHKMSYHKDQSAIVYVCGRRLHVKCSQAKSELLIDPDK